MGAVRVIVIIFVILFFIYSCLSLGFAIYKRVKIKKRDKKVNENAVNDNQVVDDNVNNVDELDQDK